MGFVPDVAKKKCVNSLQTGSRYLGGKEQMENTGAHKHAKIQN